MTTQEQLEYIRKKCVEANPDIDWMENLCDICDGTKCDGLKRHVRPIRLADVLEAMSDDIARYAKAVDELLYSNARGSCWNLHKDSLSDQSPETIAFIAGLLERS